MGCGNRRNTHVFRNEGTTQIVTTTLQSPLLSLESPISFAADRETSLLGAVPGELVLRMTVGPQAGRVVRLSAAKCSIGSAPHCTLRLRGAGIEPVHCVILRGAKQTVARRWSHDTRLNDRTFDDATLRGGDRLSLGPVEFQVVGLPADGLDVANVASRNHVAAAAASAQIDRLTRRLELANHQGRRRLRAVIGRLRKHRQRLSELEAKRAQLVQEQARLEAAQAQLAEKERELQSRTGDVDSRRDALTALEQSLAAQAAELQTRQAEARSQLDALHQALDARQREWERGSSRNVEQVEAAATERARLEQTALALREQETVRRAEADRLDERRAEIENRMQALHDRERELSDRGERLRLQAEGLERREAACVAAAESMTQRESAAAATAEELAKREAALESATAELARREEEATARCTALKNNWAELIERERRLESDREALQSLQAAAAASPAAEVPRIAASSATDERSAAEAVETERLRLEEHEAELIGRREQLERREADLAAERSLLESRRETLELAARVLGRRAAIIEADDAESMAQQAALDVRLASQADTSLNDRLQIERLEAELKTWRDEARLWKSQYDEMSLAATSSVPSEVALPTNEIPTESETSTEVVEADASSTAIDADEVTVVDAVESEEPAVDEAADEVTAEVEDVAADDTEIDDRDAEEHDLDESEADEVEADELEVEAAAAPEPVAPAESAADVLRRLGMAKVLDDANADADVKPIPPPPRPMPVPAPAVHHEGEESLDDYMKQLFQRLGVRNDERNVSQSTSSNPQPVREAPKSKIVKLEPEIPAAPQSPLTAGEFKARTVALESKASLSSLRELANVTAKAAIATHQVRTQSKKSKWRLACAVAAFAASAGCGVGYLALGHDLAKYGVVAGLVIGVLCSVQSAGFKKRAAKSARSLDDVLQKSAGRQAGNEAKE